MMETLRSRRDEEFEVTDEDARDRLIPQYSDQTPPDVQGCILRMIDGDEVEMRVWLFESPEFEFFMREMLPFYGGDVRDACAWMRSPHPQLGGATPAHCIAQGRSAEVSAVIDQLKSGAHT